MDEERCETCKNWKRSIKKQKPGWCSAWQPSDYHQKRGRGGSLWRNYGGPGVATDDGDWCAEHGGDHLQIQPRAGH